MKNKICPLYCLMLAILIVIIIESFLHTNLTDPPKPVWKSFDLVDSTKIDTLKRIQNKP
jgi:hypothetical protein